jgi:hypothetical protein
MSASVLNRFWFPIRMRSRLQESDEEGASYD